MSIRPTKPVPIRVEVGGKYYDGRYRTQSGVLTVWYGTCAKSVALEASEAESQARLVLSQMAMAAEQPAPRD